MLQNSERIKRLQAAKGVKYGYFQCVLGPDLWKRFSNEVQTMQKQVEFGVLGRNEHVAPQVVAL